MLNSTQNLQSEENFGIEEADFSLGKKLALESRLWKTLLLEMLHIFRYYSNLLLFLKKFEFLQKIP